MGICFLLCTLTLFAQQPLSVEVPYKGGRFEFRNVRVEAPPMLGTILVGEIVNKTGTGWPLIEYRLVLKGFAYKRAPAPGAYIGKNGASREMLVPDESKPLHYELAFAPEAGMGMDAGTQFRLQLGINVSEFALTGLDVTILKASSTDDVAKAREETRKRDEAIRKLALQKEAADRATAAAEQAAHQRAAIESAERRKRELAQYPKLGNGNESLPIGADEKCLDEAVEAISQGGLEARKKLPELVGYKCIFIVDRDTPVRIDRKGWRKSIVTVMDGGHEGQSGWVMSDWVH